MQGSSRSALRGEKIVVEYSEQTRCQRSLWIVVVLTWRRGIESRNGQLVGIEGTGKISSLIITSNMGIWRKRKGKKREISSECRKINIQGYQRVLTNSNKGWI